MTKRTRIVLIHIVAWIVYYVYEYTIISIIGYREINIVESISTFLFNVAIFYLYILLLFPVFLERKRYLEFFGYAIVATGMLVYFRYQMKVTVAPYISDQPLINPYESLRLFLAETIWRGGYFLIIASFYWFANKSIRQEKEKRRLEQQRRKDEQHLRILETNLKDAEIAYLKNQINPHFLFNTLNFFYDQIYPHSESVAEGVLLLSKIMRYALQQSDTPKVMLADAIEHLKDYIAINQLRFNNRLHVQLKITGDPTFRMIIPLVLITFVENCFKYGDLHDPAHPLRINITITDQQLIFCTHNKKKTGPIERSTGIGIENTRRRLNVVYENNYDLHIDDQPDFYTAKLTINL